MPRKKKSAGINLAVENEKLSSEIAKAEAMIAEAKEKMKENNEKIQKAKIDKLINSGFSLDELITLVDTMIKKSISIQQITSLIDDAAEKVEQKAEDIGEINAESEKALNEMMATLPSYDN